MKKMSVFMVAILLPGAACAAGIDCAKARSVIEKTICGDPELIDYDGRIAAAYARRLKAFDGQIASWVRANQKLWLTELGSFARRDDEIEPACAVKDLPCVRDFVRRRVDEIEGGAFEYGGVWKAADGAKLIVRSVRNNDYALILARKGAMIRTTDDSKAQRWDGPISMLAEMGDANGLPMSSQCRVSIRYRPLVATVTQTGTCGGTSFAGSYRRDLADDAANYEFSID